MYYFDIRLKSRWFHVSLHDQVNNVGSMLFISVFMCVFATCLLEMRWSGVGFVEWWRDEQAWVIGGVSARLFAVFQGLLKAAAGIDTDLKWSIAMLVPPTTVLILNLIGVVAGFSSAFSNGYESLGPLLGRLFFAFWVIAHLYPFLKGRLLGFRSRTPTIVVVWSILVASVFSFLWLRIDPFLPTLDGPALEECGLDCIWFHLQIQLWIGFGLQIRTPIAEKKINLNRRRINEDIAETANFGIWHCWSFVSATFLLGGWTGFRRKIVHCVRRNLKTAGKWRFSQSGKNEKFSPFYFLKNPDQKSSD